MTLNKQPLYRSAAYVNGQLMALQALVFALARAQPDRMSLCTAMEQSIELLRTATLPTAMPDDYFLGIDAVDTDVHRLKAADMPR
jgi:hypothetical protein